MEDIKWTTSSDGTYIREGELYSLPELTKRLGVGSATVRRWRREGLPVIRSGNTPFYSGRHVIAFMEARASNEAPGESDPQE